jgi:hypothetical protein
LLRLVDEEVAYVAHFLAGTVNDDMPANILTRIVRYETAVAHRLQGAVVRLLLKNHCIFGRQASIAIAAAIAERIAFIGVRRDGSSA